MPTFIVKIKDYYLEWSTIVDAPVTYGMSLDEFKAYYQEEYGRDGMRDLDQRLQRVERYGSSHVEGRSAEDILSINRAGPDETDLTFDEIYQAYCLGQPIEDEWTVPDV